ncbi:MAG: hypothetical protein WBF33_08805 [Candidatus Nitrosopolaris sp.]
MTGFSLYHLRTSVMTLLVSVGIICTLIIPLTSAQTSSFKKSASGISLGAVLQPSPSPVHKGIPTNITIIFLTLGLGKKGGGIVQPHVDYDVTILKDGKKEFRVSAYTGQPGQPLHSDGGIIIFPYTFQQRGVYVANITVYGILFSPLSLIYDVWNASSIMSLC